jgi:hypothetical protein
MPANHSGFPEPEMSEVVLRIITLERHDWFKHKDGSGRGKNNQKNYLPSKTLKPLTKMIFQRNLMRKLFYIFNSLKAGTRAF